MSGRSTVSARRAWPRERGPWHPVQRSSGPTVFRYSGIPVRENVFFRRGPLILRNPAPRMSRTDIGLVIIMTVGAPGKSANLVRMTRQRRAILEEFRTGDEHLTADEVYNRVRRRLGNISLGTVYRNLDVLSQAGLVRKLSLGGGQKRYDGRLGRHYHVRCVKCGAISDIPAERFGDLDALAAGNGFVILDHQLEFEGLCPSCQSCQSCQ